MVPFYLCTFWIKSYIKSNSNRCQISDGRNSRCLKRQSFVSFPAKNLLVPMPSNPEAALISSNYPCSFLSHPICVTWATCSTAVGVKTSCTIPSGKLCKTMKNLQPFNWQILEIEIGKYRKHSTFQGAYSTCYIMGLLAYYFPRCVLTCKKTCILLPTDFHSGSYPQLPSGAPGVSISFFFGSFWPSAAAAMPSTDVASRSCGNCWWICWIYPTPSNSGIFQGFLGLPYQRCSNPACCWVGGRFKS